MFCGEAAPAAEPHPEVGKAYVSQLHHSKGQGGTGPGLARCVAAGGRNDAFPSTGIPRPHLTTCSPVVIFSGSRSAELAES